MAVYVNTNVSSLNGRRYLNNVQNQLTTTYQRLSSGLCGSQAVLNKKILEGAPAPFESA